MKTQLIVIALVLSSCGAHVPLPAGSCNVYAAGNFDNIRKSDGLTNEILQEMVMRAMGSTAYVRDHRLGDQIENCKAMQGYAVFTKPPGEYPKILTRSGKQMLAAGFTMCWNRQIVVVAPEDGVWSHSAIIHELYHAMQGCNGTQPVDKGQDLDHANWVRDGIYDAIQDQMNRP